MNTFETEVIQNLIDEDVTMAQLILETENSKIESDPGIQIDSLSKRELEILDHIAQGLSNNDISKTLTLALSTVKGHIQKIYKKLQVQRRTEAVAHARELKIIL